MNLALSAPAAGLRPQTMALSEGQRGAFSACSPSVKPLSHKTALSDRVRQKPTSIFRLGGDLGKAGCPVRRPAPCVCVSVCVGGPAPPPPCFPAGQAGHPSPPGRLPLQRAWGASSWGPSAGWAAPALLSKPPPRPTHPPSLLWPWPAGPRSGAGVGGCECARTSVQGASREACLAQERLQKRPARPGSVR